MSIYLQINRRDSFALVKKMNSLYERKQNLKVGRIRPHGGRFCSCII